MRGLVTPEPTEIIPEYAHEDTESKKALRVLELAMEVSDILLSTGASANDVTVTVRKIARAYALRAVQVDVTFTSISLSWHRAEREPLTTLRVIRSRTVDYSRLQKAYDLAHAIETGRLDLDDAERELRRVRRVQRPYRRWVVVGSSGVVAAGVCQLFGATALVTVLAFLSSCLVHLTLDFLSSKDLPTFFCQAVGAAIPTSLTLLVEWLQGRGVSWLAETRPTLIVAAGIVLLLAGMSTVGAAQDSIDGYYVTASARAFEVVMLTLGIVAGLIAVLRLGKSFGLTVYLGAGAPVLGPVPGQLIGAVVISAAFAVGCHAGPRTVVLCAGMGLVGWLMYMAGTLLTFGPVGSSAIGSLVAAVIATTIAGRLKVPSLALITAGIVPLMPGSMVYRGTLLMTEAGTASDTVAGIMMLLNAAGVGLGLAAGTSLGTFLARPISERPKRTRRRLT
ncbi:threonine/serine exporter family protein [Mariniluteicoccus endophyticus]